MKLKDGKVPGNDGFTTEFLKKLASGISEPLAMIYNKSLLEGVVPHEWKQANITPLFKKGSKSEPGNYRPVSLTSYLGKILEAILKVNIMDHITVNSLINASQNGFLSRRSCLTNLLEFLANVNSRSRSLYAVSRPSVVCLSSVCLSVCDNVRGVFGDPMRVPLVSVNIKQCGNRDGENEADGLQLVCAVAPLRDVSYDVVLPMDVVVT